MFFFILKLFLKKKQFLNSLKTLCIFLFLVVLLYLQYFKMFSAILIKRQKNENFRTEKLSADQNFGRKNFRTKKNPKVFPSESFRS